MASSEVDAPLPPVVALMGPTAAGKTAIALELARRFPVGLVSVDSAQVYRGLDIGSAKPDPDTLAAYPHALIDIREPEESYSVADFCRDCEAEIRRIAALGQLPVLVGGTMMYFRSMIYGLDAMPEADPELRQAIAAEGDRRGWPAMHAELIRHDPIAAGAIEVADRQRIQRALEVVRLTGQGPSGMRRHNRIPRLPSCRLVVTPADRQRLHQRIAQRLEAMLEQGFMDEVAKLRQRPGLDPGSGAMRSVGYRQAWQHLDGEFELDEFRARTKAATRQLAKRQLTSLRQMSRALWYDPDGSLTLNLVFRQVEGFLKRRGSPN
ncbi:MAG: tRNA (adenosine(37)-N6)-dimethylallyltransferase MiaA [Wenzhouxiangella sp.]